MDCAYASAALWDYWLQLKESRSCRPCPYSDVPCFPDFRRGCHRKRDRSVFLIIRFQELCIDSIIGLTAPILGSAMALHGLAFAIILGIKSADERIAHGSAEGTARQLPSDSIRESPTG